MAMSPRSSRKPPAPPPADALLAAIIDSSDDAILSKDLEGTITSWNKGAERIFGYAAAEAVGRHVDLILPEERRAEEATLLRRIIAGERIEHFETQRRRMSGEVFDAAVTLSPIRDHGGTIVGVSNVCRDTSEQRRQGRATSLLAAIVSSSDDAIVSKDLTGVITSWNAGAERIFGYTAAEAVGRSVLMLLPDDRKAEEPKILEQLRRGERVDHFETVRVRKNGEHFPVSLTISPVKDPDGRIIGASKIARDITELKRAAAEREQLLESERVARAQAEHASRMKDDFLSTVSHELRTPLNAILGWTQILREAKGRPEDIADGIEVIARNASVQAQLIDDLLDLGRIAAGKMTLDVQWLEIGNVVQDAIGSVRHAAAQKQIGIRTILNDIRGGMMGDKQRLQQVVWNLLSNAIKFTPKRGKVLVTITRVNSHVEITVADNGRGISRDFLPHVFERFRQADASTTRQFGGLGIGLALVKQLIELHGGEVRAESPGEGQGATFTVSLPVVATRSDHAPEKTNASDEPGPAENLTDIRVLVVDDDRDSLEVVRRVLGNRRAVVEVASSTEEALEIFARFHPDVILSDIGMPGHDGYEFIRRIRTRPDGRTVPAAALTALARAEDRMRALNAGFQTHVAKPVMPVELVAVVRSLATMRT